MFTGIALGPSLGSLLIRVTGDTLSVYYFAATAQLLYGIFVFFILPESVSKERRKQSKLAYNATANDNPRSFRIQKLFAFLSPLSIFSPAIVEAGRKGRKTDWNLTFIAIAFGLTLSAAVSLSRDGYNTLLMDELGYGCKHIPVCRIAIWMAVRDSTYCKTNHFHETYNDSDWVLDQPHMCCPGYFPYCYLA